MRIPMTPTWVVYVVPLGGGPGGPRAVCRQAEWEALERDRPGVYTLVRAGIPTEGEAERLARGSAGASRPRPFKPRLFERLRERDTRPATGDRAAA